MKQIEALFRNPVGYELSLPDYESSSIKFLLPINSVELLESTLELNDFDKKYLHNISANGHLDKVELDYGKNQVFGILVEAGNYSLHIGNTKTPSYTPITEEVEKAIISSLREFMLEKTGKDITKEKWNSKENVQVKFKVKLLPEGNDYVERWSEDNDSVEKGLFVFKEKDSFIAIDNRDGNCWTEDFDSLYHALVYASEAPFDLEEIKKMTMGDAKENAEKLHDEEEMAVMEKAFIHRYYLTERPVDIGTQPKGFINSKNFGYKTHDRTAGFNAWGYVEYDRELTEKEIKDYELRKPREFNPVPYEKKWKQDPSIINRMLAKDRSSEPTNSIWDEVQSCKTLAPGVYDVSTAGHGGIMVHSSVAKEFLSKEALNAAYREGEWFNYEEDCDASIVLLELYRNHIMNGYDWNKGKEEKFYMAMQESAFQWNEEYWNFYEKAVEKRQPDVNASLDADGIRLNNFRTNESGLREADVFVPDSIYVQKAAIDGGFFAMPVATRNEDGSMTVTVEKRRPETPSDYENSYLDHDNLLSTSDLFHMFQEQETYDEMDKQFSFDEKKFEKYVMTEDEFNVVEMILSESHMDSSFDVVQLDGTDAFRDFDEDEYVPLKTGLSWLYEGLVEPTLSNLSPEQMKTLSSLFNSQNILDGKRFNDSLQLVDGKDETIKEWYSREYPDDKEIIEKMNSNSTFRDFESAVNEDRYNYNPRYDYGDSVARERIFTKISELNGEDYSVIYDKWMQGKGLRDPRYGMNWDGTKYQYPEPEEQLRINAEDILYGLQNVYNDNPAEPKITIIEARRYALDQVYDYFSDGEGGCTYKDGICAYLRALGNSRTLEIIDGAILKTEPSIYLQEGEVQKLQELDEMLKDDSLVKILSHNKVTFWDDRKAAKEFYFSAMFATEGSESDGYKKICYALEQDKVFCSDEYESIFSNESYIKARAREDLCTAVSVYDSYTNTRKEIQFNEWKELRNEEKKKEILSEEDKAAAEHNKDDLQADKDAGETLADAQYRLLESMSRKMQGFIAENGLDSSVESVIKSARHVLNSMNEKDKLNFLETFRIKDMKSKESVDKFFTSVTNGQFDGLVENKERKFTNVSRDSGMSM